MFRLFARRAAPALLRQPRPDVSAAAVAAVRRQRAAGYASSGEAGGDGEEKSPVVIFLEALGIDAKYEANIKDLETLLYDVKTERLKREGMTVQDRKKLLSHIEKYKRGLWAPRELRHRN